MTNSTMRLAAAFALWAGAGWAGFAEPTLCTGEMKFFNDDGTFLSYDLRLTLEADSYVIVAQNHDTGEITEDAGACGAYLAGGCRHAFPPVDDFPGSHYEFRLEAGDDGRYVYTEEWSDGFSGTTTVDCRPLPAAGAAAPDEGAGAGGGG